jgi:hypothetical protein
MINNLPAEFPIKKLEEVDFGGAEAKTDNLIDTALGFCWTRPIHEFVKGKRNIVIGERGSGKSVLFKLLSEGKLQFKKKKGEHQLLLPIEEELQYGTLKDYVDKHVVTFISDPSIKYRIVWELFLLSRTLTFLSTKYSQTLPEELKKANSYLSIILGYKKDPISFIEILKNAKATIGLKFGSSNVGQLEPNLYGTVEQSSGGTSNDEDQNIDIDMYKKQIQQFLESKKMNLFILIDKVDEFVIKGDYDVQRQVLQALMETEKSYMDYSCIKFKLFIRCDLYKRLEYDALGADKLAAKKINLIWTDVDIRRLLAQRLMHNYFSVFNLSKLEFEVDDDELYVDEYSIDTFRDEELMGSSDNFILRFLRYIKKHIHPNSSKDKTRQIEGRHTTIDDEISKQIITSVFPHNVKHIDKNGQSKEIDLFEYLISHFSLSSGTTTPRLIIIFLDICLSMAKEYYRNNQDEKVPLDHKNEYQLFKRKIIQSSYTEFQKELAESFIHSSSHWKSYFIRFVSKKGKKVNFTLSDLYKILGNVEEEEVRRFIAFMCHIGYFKCHNPKAMIDNRKYSLPILFQC